MRKKPQRLRLKKWDRWIGTFLSLSRRSWAMAGPTVSIDWTACVSRWLTFRHLQVELPDSFFDLSTQELKHLLAQSRRQAEKLMNRPLITKELRDQEKKKEMQLRKTKYPKTRVRVRFPDMVSMEATFLSEEPSMCFEYALFKIAQLIGSFVVSILFSTISSVLEDQGREFHLSDLAVSFRFHGPFLTSHFPSTASPALPKKELDPAVSFAEAGLTPATNVYVTWKNPADPSYLSAESRKQLKPLPKPKIVQPSEPEAMELDEKPAAGRTLGGPSAPPAEKKQDDGARGGEKGKSKLPAWLKLNKK
jgi:tether containing UBX domain for GLUT4